MTMTERAYLVAEIDRMRQIIKHQLSPRQVVNGQLMVVGDSWSSTGVITPAVSPAIVEDQLRTYMLAGIGPDDLEAEWTGAGLK